MSIPSKFACAAAAAILALGFGLPSPGVAAMTDKEKADAQQIDTACAEDAKTTSCAGKEAGKGLIKCMQDYAKANKTFKHTASCQAALKQMHADEKAAGASGGASAAPSSGTSK
jgi:hypothetical protein